MKIVDTRCNGQQAVEAVKNAFLSGKTEYSLILMDYSMPIMDGYTASVKIKQFLKERSQQLPKIVACTGHLEQEFIEKSWISNMDEVIGKPMNIELVEEVLSEIIDFEVINVGQQE